MSTTPQRLEGIVSAVQTAASGSFSAAARVLGLTPAAVSKNVATLEAALGVRLFNRSTRALALTEEGRRFVEPARLALDALNAASDGLHTRQRTPEGVVRMSVGAGFGRLHVLPHLPEFAAQFPNVRLELSLDDRAVDLVREGFDIGIRGSATPPPGMVARKICDLPLVLVASADYVRRHGVPKHVADLAGHHAVGTRFQSGQYASWEFAEGRQRSAFVPPARLWLSDPDATLQAALLGLGVAQVGLYHAWRHLKSGALVALLHGQHVSGNRTLAAYYPHRAGLAPRVRAVLDFVLPRMAQDEALRVGPADVRGLVAQAARMPARRASSASTKRSS